MSTGMAPEATTAISVRVAGPGRRLLEEQRHAGARRGPGQRRRLRLGRVSSTASSSSSTEIVDVEQVPGRPRCALVPSPAGEDAPRMAIASSISSSDTSSDGARRNASDGTAFTTSPASSAAAARPSARARRRVPRASSRPCATHRDDPGKRRQPLAARRRRARPGGDVLASMTAQRRLCRATWRAAAHRRCCRGPPARTPPPPRRGPSTPRRASRCRGPWPWSPRRAATPRCWKPNQRPGAAEAGLDLVEHEEDAPLGAQLAARRAEIVRGRARPRLPRPGSARAGRRRRVSGRSAASSASMSS